KLLGLTTLVPIALLMLARLWQIWREQSGRRFAGLLPIIVGIVACILTMAAFLLPFINSYQVMVQSVFTFHNDAASMFSNTQQGNASTIEHALTSLLEFAALYGIVAALFRKVWCLLPLIAWLIATILLLLHPVY